MKKPLWIFFALLAVAGLGLMVLSYDRWLKVEKDVHWRNAFLSVSKKPPKGSLEGFEHTEIRVRLLPATERAQLFLAQAKVDEDMRTVLELALRDKLVALPALEETFTDDMLAAGRFPAAGALEAVAGPLTTQEATLACGDDKIAVVGRLRDDIALFEHMVVMPDLGTNTALFEVDGETVWRGDLVSGLADPLPGEDQDRLRAAFAKSLYSSLGASAEARPGPFFIYLGGMALFLAGGTGLLIGVWFRLSRAGVGPPFGRPLAVIAQWPRLFISLHAASFLLFLLFAALAYAVPEIRAAGRATVDRSLSDPNSPLGIAAEAYLSRNIFYAAGITVGINFFLGSVMSITLPSFVFPGAGVLLVLFRSVMVGVMLAPSDSATAFMMMPHSLTILLELEAYIVAAFYAALVPLYLFRRDGESTVLERYFLAVGLNIRAQLLIFAALLVVAIYEAIEVIMMLK